MVKSAYFPLAKIFPFMVTSSLNEIVEFSFAPVRHYVPKGTKSPKIVLPLTLGLE
jgi:hypothetical protein